MQRGVKICPRCHNRNEDDNMVCGKCGYQFRGVHRNGFSLKKVLIFLVIIAALWIGFRLFSKQPIIPSGLSGLIKNMTLPQINKSLN